MPTVEMPRNTNVSTNERFSRWNCHQPPSRPKASGRNAPGGKHSHRLWTKFQNHATGPLSPECAAREACSRS